MIHHSERGVQYVSIRYAERLAEANIQPSVGSRGDSYDNALAKNERLVQNQTNPSPRPLENARSGRNRNLRMVHWFNHQRLQEPIGHIPPAEAEECY